MRTAEGTKHDWSETYAINYYSGNSVYGASCSTQPYTPPLISHGGYQRNMLYASALARVCTGKCERVRVRVWCACVCANSVACACCAGA